PAATTTMPATPVRIGRNGPKASKQAHTNSSSRDSGKARRQSGDQYAQSTSRRNVYWRLGRRARTVASGRPRRQKPAARPAPRDLRALVARPDGAAPQGVRPDRTRPNQAGAAARVPVLSQETRLD